MELEQKVESAINFLIDVSKEFDENLPWELGFSGGKDSSVTLTLLIKAIERGAKINKLYVVYSDTLLEHPKLRKKNVRGIRKLKDI
jgi:DNA sulfur modification protein DndC